jgi:hypothetical protein
MDYSNEYEIFGLLKEAMQMHQISRYGENNAFGKMVQSGSLYQQGDYGTGFLYFQCLPVQHNKDGDWSIRVYIETIDDGGWGCWVDGLAYDKCIERIRKFADEYLKNLVVLPTLEQLNKDIQVYGFYITEEC